MVILYIRQIKTLIKKTLIKKTLIKKTLIEKAFSYGNNQSDYKTKK
jgi:hypothetical protein